MGKGSVSLPKPPSYFEDPNFMSGVDQLLGLGGKLTNFDFSGSLSPLQDVITSILICSRASFLHCSHIITRCAEAQ